jgi:hypothetical protein
MPRLEDVRAAAGHDAIHLLKPDVLAPGRVSVEVGRRESLARVEVLGELEHRLGAGLAEVGEPRPAGDVLSEVNDRDAGGRRDSRQHRQFLDPTDRRSG